MMNKLLILFVAVIGFSTLQAKPIDRRQVAQQARDFVSHNFSKSSVARRAAQTVTLNTVETGQSLVHAFNIEGGGYVVVAGDDCAPAILGFSETASIDPSDMPDGMKDLFAQYQLEMQAMSLNGQRAAEMESLGDPIAPLMKCKWGQTAPYNYMTPRYNAKDKNGKTFLSLSYTGCPATAMAQILYYHQHPAAITELPGDYYNDRTNSIVKAIDVSRELEWDKILPTYGSRTKVEGTQEQQNAVAKLMRLVGQSSCMGYSPTGSGTWECAIMNSFVNYFNYDASTIKLIDRVNYSYLDWIKTIHQELQNKRPVFFSGSSPNSGHSFVIDGYYTQDYFYINWGWNGLEDKHAFRLSLCNPGKKYEGGGVGDAGYSGAQLAIIGIQPASTPQHIDPILEGFFHWLGNFTYRRSAADQDFNLEQSIFYRLYNKTHVHATFSFGVIVRDADGQTVQSLLPLGPDYENLKLEPGRQIINRPKLHLGASLGDGTYTMQFVHRIGQGEWKATVPVRKIMFKIKGNELIFDCRPDWLAVQKSMEKVEGTQKPQYKVTVKLENKSTDKTYHRTIRLRSDDQVKNLLTYGATVTLEPGESQTVIMDYIAGKYVPKTLYLSTLEDCVAMSEGVATEADYQTGKAAFEGKLNITDVLQQTGQNYVLRTDGNYEVICNLKNTGTGDFKGYIELVDSVGPELGQLDEDNYEGDVLSLKPGESKDLKLTIHNFGDANTLHKVSLVEYNENDQAITLMETNPFVMRPIYNLSMSDVSVTPTKPIDDELSDFIATGNQLTVKGKISNPEATDFEGSIVLRRYVDDLNREYSVDEDGNCYLEPDETLTREVTIPAGGSIDYTETLNLQGLAQDAYYSVLVDFDISFMRKSSDDEVLLYDSDSYLVYDGSVTGIVDVVPAVGSPSTAIYDLKGRRVSGKLAKGIYIIGGKKKVVK